MAKIIQITAMPFNDNYEQILYGLDERGNLYQYIEITKAWEYLAPSPIIIHES